MVGLRILDMPVEEERLNRWLEDQIAGPNLRRLICELATIQQVVPTEATSAQLNEWLGDNRQAIVDSGLAGVSHTKVRELIQHPGLLLALQEWVLLEGGEYWQAKWRSSAIPPLSLAKMLQWIEGEGLETPEHTESVRPLTSQVRSVEGGLGRRAMVAAMAIAALVLFVVGLRTMFVDPAGSGLAAGPTWGWTEKQLMQMRSLSEPEYLEQLAVAGEAWFKKRPTENEALRNRLSDMIAGCTLVIAENRQQPSTETRTWLLEKCEAWNAKFQTQLAALDQGSAPLEVREAVDDVVNKLVTALRTKAGELRTNSVG